MIDSSLLILERSNHNLDIKTKGSEYVLEGIFAEFGKENNNNRIYEENEYLPHLEYLRKKINEKKLMGELDHPEKFDISLSNVSHIIESIDYDKKSRTIVGRIRLLDTPAGRIAKNLVDNGIPLHISSRAAGEVRENKKVVIKRIFTYDLVADPGFENAKMVKVNESFGFSNNDKNIAIYRIKDHNNEKNKEMEETQYISIDEMERYSQHIKKEFDRLSVRINESAFNYRTDDNIRIYLDKLSETINNLIKYSEYLSETINNSIKYTETISSDISEGLNNKLEKIIKFTNYLSEKLDQSIQYTEAIEEKNNSKINKVHNKLSEKIDNSIKYGEYLAEMLDKGIGYSEFIAENVIEKKDFNNLIRYTEEMLERISTDGFNPRKSNSIVDISLDENDKYKNNLDKKIDLLLEQANAHNEGAKIKAIETKYPFLRFLSESKVEEFSKLSETEKERVSKALLKRPSYNEEGIVKVWESALKEVEINEAWFTQMPSEYVKIWESLDQTKKEMIIRQSKLYNLDTAYKIKNFWDTRGLKTTYKLNENLEVQTDPIKDKTTLNLGYSSEYVKGVRDSLLKLKK
jgi:hypothetical protein